MLLTRLLLFSCVCIWGWSFVATKISLQYITPIEVLGWRMLLALPVLYVITRAKGISLKISKAHRWPIIFGGLILVVHFTIQFEGINHTSATNCGWIIAVTPLVIAATSFVFLRERIGFSGFVGIFVATAGILLLISNGKIGDFEWLRSYGDWLILGSAHTWAFYTIVTRNSTRNMRPLAVTVWVFLPSLIAAVAVMSASTDWDKFVRMPLDGWIATIFLGVASTALAHWWWQEGVSGLGATRAGVFLYLEPMATTALAVPLLGEHFGIFTAVGGVLVLGGVYLAQGIRRKPVSSVAT